MRWFADAPSNIALIKYMGKRDALSNLPDNSSLSYTLNHLVTSVELESCPNGSDRWELLNLEGTLPFELSAKGQERFMRHLQKIKKIFDYEGSFTIRSCNNFPHSSGLASSASSFAALTRCALQALSDLTGRSMPSIEEQAALSRQGSGSSCRSFYSPWALWSDDAVKSIDLPYSQLIHQVVVISDKEKAVSSSEAHQRVQTSLEYVNRPERAEANLRGLLHALKSQDWESAYHLCWKEFQDMHHLFESCSQPFSYMTPDSLTLLAQLQLFWEKEGDGPLITMDAGPNIHLLYRLDQEDMAARVKQDYLAGHYDVL